MSLDNFFIIIQQALAIILSIGVLNILSIWVARSLEQEEQRKVTLEIARQVRWSAFQRSVEILQTDGFFEGSRLSKSIRLEEQDGIE
jgi:UDP-3-O-acyl-N-acetylglucosamine deacetylase